MTNQWTIQDQNKVQAQLLHTGTADTAETVRATGQTSGAANVFMTGGTVTGGTISLIEGGTLNVVQSLGAGTITRIEGGTISVNMLSGTLNLGTVTVNNITGTTPLPTGAATEATLGSINTKEGTVAATFSTLGGTVILNNPYSVRVDEVASGTTYVGEASVASNEGSSVWRIKRIIEASGTTTILYADGNLNFDNAWTGHGTINYS